MESSPPSGFILALHGSPFLLYFLFLLYLSGSVNISHASKVIFHIEDNLRHRA